MPVVATAFKDFHDLFPAKDKDADITDKEMKHSRCIGTNRNQTCSPCTAPLEAGEHIRPAPDRYRRLARKVTHTARAGREEPYEGRS